MCRKIHSTYILFFFLLIAFLPTLLFAQSFPVLEFQRFYGGQTADFAKKIIKTGDNALVMGGYSFSEAEGCTNVRLIKIDTLGNVIWDKNFAMKGCQELHDMAATEDSGLVFVGVSNTMITHKESSDVNYQADFWVGKIDKTGTGEWLRTFGGQELDMGNAVAVNGKEYFMVGGTFSHDEDISHNHGGSDIWYLKTDEKANTLISNTLGGKGTEWGQAIAICKNGDFIISGFTNSQDIEGNISETPTTRDGNAFLMRVQKEGKIAWLRTFPTPNGGIFNDIAEDAQGRILVAGSYNAHAYNAEFWLLKLTAEGKVILDRRFGNESDEYLTSVTVCSDTTYLFGGYSAATKNPKMEEYKDAHYYKGKDDFWLIKLDRFGNTSWKKTYGGFENERCMSVLEFRKGTLFAFGEKDNFFTETKDGNKDFWLLKITDNKCDSLPLDIFVRANEMNEVAINTPVRFRARHNYGERFLWDFNDGTTSTEEQPLKTFTQAGNYEVILTVFINESCKASYTIPRPVQVK